MEADDNENRSTESGNWSLMKMNNRDINTGGCLTLSPPTTYANSLDPDETPSNSASHPDPSRLTLRECFHQF